MNMLHITWAFTAIASASFYQSYLSWNTSMKLLEIQSSVRVEKSISRLLSQQFVQTWQAINPDRQHKQRDVGINRPPHPTELLRALCNLQKRSFLVS